MNRFLELLRRHACLKFHAIKVVSTFSLAPIMAGISVTLDRTFLSPPAFSQRMDSIKLFSLFSPILKLGSMAFVTVLLI